MSCACCTEFVGTYGIRQKERNSNVKFVHCFFIKNAPHFYNLPMVFGGKRATVLFATRATVFANMPQFSETRLDFMGKVPQFLDCSTLQDNELSGIASKCGGHRWISTVHSTPC